MNKEQFTTILQAGMFYFDGATQQEILELNTYDPRLVAIAIKLTDYIQTLNLEKIK